MRELSYQQLRPKVHILLSLIIYIYREIKNIFVHCSTN